MSMCAQQCESIPVPLQVPEGTSPSCPPSRANASAVPQPKPCVSLRLVCHLACHRAQGHVTDEHIQQAECLQSPMESVHSWESMWVRNTPCTNQGLPFKTPPLLKAAEDKQPQCLVPQPHRSLQHCCSHVIALLPELHPEQFRDVLTAPPASTSSKAHLHPVCTHDVHKQWLRGAPAGPGLCCACSLGAQASCCQVTRRLWCCRASCPQPQQRWLLLFPAQR